MCCYASCCLSYVRTVWWGLLRCHMENEVLGCERIVLYGDDMWCDVMLCSVVRCTLLFWCAVLKYTMFSLRFVLCAILFWDVTWIMLLKVVWTLWGLEMSCNLLCCSLIWTSALCTVFSLWCCIVWWCLLKCHMARIVHWCVCMCVWIV